MFAAICGAAFVVMVALVSTGRPRLDLEVATWIADHRTATGIAIARGLSRTGSVVTIVPLAVVMAVILWRRDGWAPVRLLALASVGATALYLAINQIMRSPRPPMPLRMTEELGWSFPSGHSTQAMVFWPTLAILLGTTIRARRWLMVPALVLVFAIGGARIYLDVHWTTDVASGFLLGAAWLFGLLAYRRDHPARG